MLLPVAIRLLVEEGDRGGWRTLKELKQSMSKWKLSFSCDLTAKGRKPSPSTCVVPARLGPFLSSAQFCTHQNPTPLLEDF